MAAAMGANVRVGLEDSLWDGPGKLAESNAVQVRRVRGILEGLGLEVATAAEAREILAAMEKAKAEGAGATVYKGRLVDMASIKQAEVTLRQSDLIGA
mgnify:CR=1 FL=1